MAYQNSEYWNTVQYNFRDASFVDSGEALQEVVTCSVSSEAMTIKEHSHDYIELLYVVASSMNATVNKHDYELNSGDLLVIIPGDVHSYSFSDKCKLISIKADTNFLFSQILSSTDLHYSMPYLLSKFNEARLFKAEEIDATDIPKQVHSVVNEYFAKANFYKLSIRCSLNYIALYIFRRWDELKSVISEKESTQNKEGMKRLSEVLKVMETRYMDDLTVSELANIAGMSYSFFSRFFKSTMNLTFSEYLNSIRIQEAEKLLANSDMSVAEIGDAVGFTNTSYFIAQFKKQLHITPKKYKTNFGKR